MARSEPSIILDDNRDDLLKDKGVRARGFTFVELMIAMVLVGILAAVAIPTFDRFLFDAEEVEGIRMLYEVRRDQVRVYNECLAGLYSSCAGGGYTEAFHSSDPNIPYLYYRPGKKNPRFNLVAGSFANSANGALKFSLNQIGYNVPAPIMPFGFPVSGGVANNKRYLVGAIGYLRGYPHVMAINEAGSLILICDAWSGAGADGNTTYVAYSGGNATCSNDRSFPNDPGGSGDPGSGSGSGDPEP